MVGSGVFDFETDISCNIVTKTALSASNDGSDISTFTPSLVGQYGKNNDQLAFHNRDERAKRRHLLRE